jgi:NAD(P)-dependent dehydrogenase (short-subunit alcohol dehydrogenase family)
MNTFAPLLAMKHFAPLLQSSKTLSGMDDLSKGLLPEHHNIIANMSARVGSINDNRKGGWYSYRASKAAQNQITRTASLEMSMRKVPAICVGLHPGTVRTDLSKDFTGGARAKQGDQEQDKTAERRSKGEFEADESASLLTGVISRLTTEDSGLVWDYAGKQVPY